MIFIGKALSRFSHIFQIFWEPDFLQLGREAKKEIQNSELLQLKFFLFYL